MNRIGRKGRVVNLAGEKLTDAHVNEGIAFATKQTGAELLDYTVVGKIAEGDAHYVIAAMFNNNVDPTAFANAFDEAVCASNGEFHHSLEFGALGPTIVKKMEKSHT